MTPDFRLPILLALLGSPDWNTSETAHQVLRKTPDIPIVLLQACESDTSTEAAHRCRLIVNEFYRRTATLTAMQLLPRKYPRMPWIHSSTWETDLEMHYRRLAIETFDIDPAKDSGDFVVFRCATLLMVEDMIRARTPRSEILDYLDQLAAEEITWRTRYGHPIPKTPLVEFPPKRK